MDNPISHDEPSLPIVWRRHAFAEPIRDTRQAGMSVAEVVRSLPQLPERFWQDGVVLVSDQPVPRHLWERVRPKPQPDGSVDVTLWLAPQGGGNTASILTLVASIALLAAASFVSGGALAPFLGAAFLGGQIGAIGGAAAVSCSGSFAVNALEAPP